MKKLSKKELESVILETLLEMIEEGDEGLIKLMRESEKLNGEIEEDLNEWVSQTKAVIQESLGIDRDVITESEEEDTEMDILTEGHMETLRLAGILEEADKDAARELEIFINNDSVVYHQRIEPILKNLSKKAAKGQYDQKKAVKGWMYAVETGAKKYAADFGGGSQEWSKMFDKATRMLVAQKLEKMHREEIENGDYL